MPAVQWIDSEIGQWSLTTFIKDRRGYVRRRGDKVVSWFDCGATTDLAHFQWTGAVPFAVVKAADKFCHESSGRPIKQETLLGSMKDFPKLQRPFLAEIERLGGSTDGALDWLRETLKTPLNINETPEDLASLWVENEAFTFTSDDTGEPVTFHKKPKRRRKQESLLGPGLGNINRYTDRRIGRWILRSYTGTNQQVAFLRSYPIKGNQPPPNYIQLTCDINGSAYEIRSVYALGGKLPKALLVVADRHCRGWAKLVARPKQASLLGSRKRSRR